MTFFQNYDILIIVKGKELIKMYHSYYEDTHMNHDCFNCSRSFVTDEDDELHCPFRGVVYEGEWCEDWN